MGTVLVGLPCIEVNFINCTAYVLIILITDTTRKLCRRPTFTPPTVCHLRRFARSSLMCGEFSLFQASTTRGLLVLRCCPENLPVSKVVCWKRKSSRRNSALDVAGEMLWKRKVYEYGNNDCRGSETCQIDMRLVANTRHCGGRDVVVYPPLSVCWKRLVSVGGCQNW